MKSEIKPVATIKANLGLQPNGDVQMFFTNTCYRYMDRYVPKNIGNLRDNVDIQPTMIIYESPYASYQYYGVRKDGTHKVDPANYTTPGTGTYWDQTMISNDMNTVIQEVQDYVRRRK